MPWDNEHNCWRATTCTLWCGWFTKAKRFSTATALLQKHLAAEHPDEHERWILEKDAIFNEAAFTEYVKRYGSAPPWAADAQLGETTMQTALRERNRT